MGNKIKKGKKRTLNEVEYEQEEEEEEEGEEEEYNHDEHEEQHFYPEVGVRATSTIQLAKKLFVGHHSLHFEIAQEILLRAIRRIAEFRWIHSKYNINKNDIRYLLFISEQLNIPKEFEQSKPKRGRPPKNKKQKIDDNNRNMAEHNLDINNDKIYRVNFQIIFKKNVSKQTIHEIIQCIKIDLNQNSLSLLLTNVLAAKVQITQKVQSYSLYAVDTDKLKEYEQYERDEEARKKKKREREQRRRENKEKEALKIKNFRK